ncbi:MAG: hypothetical protein L3J95_00325 [Thermoplasmata archaeon]|nr:hypothetical protein [Thermoplasmata archaeon]MCI4358866.1 hypothetical protein [Thermoplasmata archaeon]
MPLVADASGWDRDRLVELIRSQREGLIEILRRIRETEPVWRDPMSLRTARDLLTDVGALSESALAAPTAELSRLVEVANVQYDAILAGVDLLKSHSNVPMVPRPSP